MFYSIRKEIKMRIRLTKIERLEKSYWMNVVKLINKMNIPISQEEKEYISKSIVVAERGLQDMQKRLDDLKDFCK